MISPIPNDDPNVDKLISHEINKGVKYNGENIVYCKGGKIACDRGLTTLLSIFFEGYKRPTKSDIKQHCANTGKKLIPPRNVVKVGDSWSKVSQMEKDSNKSGRTLGTLVHNQLCLYARSKNERDFMRICPSPHEYTKRAIRKLKGAGIFVFFGEFAIVDPMVKYVTPIDLVGVNSNGKLTLIEVKTGYDNIFPIGKVPLGVPFDAWVNSPLNQARLQLLLPCLTLKYQYKVNVDSAWVLNINSREEVLYPLLKSMTKSPHMVYNYLIDNYGTKACRRRVHPPKKKEETWKKSKKRKRNCKGATTKGRRRRRRRGRRRKKHPV